MFFVISKTKFSFKSGEARCDEAGNIQWLTQRSEYLATYALCGFSNFASIGIMNGVLGNMVPSKAPLIVKVPLKIFAKKNVKFQ